MAWTPAHGCTQEMRAEEYNNSVTEAGSAGGRPLHGLNGGVSVWSPVTRRCGELMSMGVGVNAKALKWQLAMAG